jgi:tetratricopeptide (TPR) repeat protein
MAALFPPEDSAWPPKANSMNESRKYQLLKLALLTAFVSLFVVGVLSRNVNTLKSTDSDAIRSEPSEKWLETNIESLAVNQPKTLQTRREIMDKLRENDNDAQLHNELGIALARDGLYSEAITEFLKTIELEPGKSEAYHNLGTIYEFLEAYEESQKYLEKAVELDPENKNSASTLRRVEYVLRYQPKGKDKFQADLNKAMVSMRKDQPSLELANNILESLVVENPSSIEALNALGIAKARLGKSDEAVEIFNKAITMEPGYVYSYINLATIMESFGKYPEALDLIERAINLADKDHAKGDLAKRKRILKNRIETGK